jgi:hypothetical protein
MLFPLQYLPTERPTVMNERPHLVHIVTEAGRRAATSRACRGILWRERGPALGAVIYK